MNIEAEQIKRENDEYKSYYGNGQWGPPSPPPAGNENDAEQQKREKVRKRPMNYHDAEKHRRERIMYDDRRWKGRGWQKFENRLLNPKNNFKRYVGRRYESMKDKYHSIKIGDRRHQVSRMIDG